MLDFDFSPTHPGPRLGAVAYNLVSVKVKLKVSETDDSIKAEWARENGHDYVTITLPSASGRLGPAVLPEAMRIGQISGKNLAFRAAVTSATDSHLVTLQFLFGGQT